MSLQGSLDSFALPDVLSLLASTKKSGELRVSGNHSQGRVWLDQGQIVDAEAPRAESVAEVLFELLRQDEGSFVFDAGAGVPEGDPTPVDPALEEAQSRLVEWRTIEAVVPSLEVRIHMATEAPAGQVTVTSEQWRVLAVVAGGCQVEAVARVLSLGEFGACQVVKRMVDAGFVEVDRAQGAVASRGSGPSADLDSLVEIPARRRRRNAARSANNDAKPAADETNDSEEDDDEDELDAAVANLSAEKAQELAAQMAERGEPAEAVDAVEAAARASTPEERAEALKGVLTDEHGEPINRGLLLKFLSSVRS